MATGIMAASNKDIHAVGREADDAISAGGDETLSSLVG
jgi:hypothetical protein